MKCYFNKNVVIFSLVCFVCFFACLSSVRASSDSVVESVMPETVPPLFDQSLKQCADVVSRVNRLICYDDFAEKRGFMTEERKASEEKILRTYGFWQASKKTISSGEQVFYLKNHIINKITSRAGTPYKPELVIKCVSGQTDVYIDWKAPLYNEYAYQPPKLYVTHKFGTQAYEGGEWDLSMDGKAVFSPAPVDFVRRLKQYNKLIVQITPQSDTTQTLAYDLSGFNEAVSILVEGCYR